MEGQQRRSRRSSKPMGWRWHSRHRCRNKYGESEIQKPVRSLKRGTTGAVWPMGSRSHRPRPGAATAGLRSAIYTAAINASTGKNRGRTGPEPSPEPAVHAASGSAFRDSRSQDEGIVSAREVGKIKQLFGALESIQRSQRVGTAVEVEQDLTDAAFGHILPDAGLHGGRGRRPRRRFQNSPHFRDPRRRRPVRRSMCSRR